MRGILEAAYLFCLSWVLAQLEIQIEGREGWGRGLPILLTVFHLPILFAGYSREMEAKILSSYLLTAWIWDFQWFVWNPYWGVRRFFRERVWWFPRRLMGLPVEYYVGMAASFVPVWVLWREGVSHWALVCGALILFSAASVVVAGAVTWRPRVG